MIDYVCSLNRYLFFNFNFRERRSGMDFLNSRPFKCPYCHLDDSAASSSGEPIESDPDHDRRPFKDVRSLLYSHVLALHAVEYYVDKVSSSFFFADFYEAHPDPGTLVFCNKRTV